MPAKKSFSFKAKRTNTLLISELAFSLYHLSTKRYYFCKYRFQNNDKIMRTKLLLCILTISFSGAILGSNFQKIIIEKNAHPAVRSAAEIMARKLGIPSDSIIELTKVVLPSHGEIVLDYAKASSEQIKFIGSDPQQVKYDGYIARFDTDRALFVGKRPRSLLFAAGDVVWWKNKNSGVYLRQPAFEHRNCNIRENDVAELVTYLGTNTLLVNGMAKSDYITLEEKFPAIFQSLSPESQERIRRNKERAIKQGERYAKLCHDADVDFYPFLYGNDIIRWSKGLTEAIYKVYPSVKGTRATLSWEKASLCPSEPKTWDLVRAYVDECVKVMQGDGFFVTFWDWYGINCQCEKCKANGLNHFDNQLKKCLGEYMATMEPLKKPVIIRTWSSGVPHWSNLENVTTGGTEMQWVHAPGYGSFSGSPESVWGKAITDLPSSLSFQVKVYYSDCFPDAQYNPLIGQTGNHRCISEYQITGQTTGNFYFPASNVRHTAWTMKKNLELTGANGGVSLFWGATKQSQFKVFDDIANSVNYFAWRQLSWDPATPVDEIWMTWATEIYGNEAAPFIVDALKASEYAADNTFSTLGFGSDTNSGFSSDVYTREVRLMYTNRYYLPEYKKFLEPTLENIERVKKQKESVLLTIDTMKKAIEKAHQFLKPEQYTELTTRIQWMEDVAKAYQALDVSYWRFRYLRYLYEMRTTDPSQMNDLAKAYDEIMDLSKSMFAFAPEMKFSCYNVPLGDLHKKLGLGSPVSLMRDIYARSRGYVEDIVGPDYLPESVLRKEVRRPAMEREAEKNLSKPTVPPSQSGTESENN
jgi:hypothetical protein